MTTQTHKSAEKSSPTPSSDSASIDQSIFEAVPAAEQIQRMVAAGQGGAIKPSTILQLQRLAGNRFVTNLMRSPAVLSRSTQHVIQRTPAEDADLIYAEWQKNPVLSESAIAILEASQKEKSQAALLDAAAKLSPQMAEAISGMLHAVQFEDMVGKKNYPNVPSDLKGWVAWKNDKSNAKPAKMNCWQGVLYAAFVTNILTKEELRQLDSQAKMQTPIIARLGIEVAESNGNRLLRKGAAGTTLMFGGDLSITAGSMVFFGSTGAEHVALATGRKKAIADQKLANEYGRTDGYEIVELDRDNPEKTIVVTTIEDKMNGAYAGGLGWASLYAIRQKLGEENAQAEEANNAN